MIVDYNSPDNSDVRIRLQEMISVSKISSLDLLSEYMGLDESATRNLVQNLVDEGSIAGSFSEDGTRFFLSTVKVTEAPVIHRYDDVPVTKRISSKSAKVTALTGFLMVVAGWILRGMTSIHQGFENAGTAIFMLGFVVMSAGWILISKNNPPEKLR